MAPIFAKTFIILLHFLNADEQEKYLHLVKKYELYTHTDPPHEITLKPSFCARNLYLNAYVFET
jgi:hypothetical protein